jgi:hypothetical protein
VVVRIAAAGIVSDPAVPLGVDVRSVGMAGLVAKVAGSAAAGDAGPGGASWSGSGPMSGNVAAAHAPSSALLDFLCESREREDEQGCEESDEPFHGSLLCVPLFRKSYGSG